SGGTDAAARGAARGLRRVPALRRARVAPCRGAAHASHHALRGVDCATMGGSCIQDRLPVVRFAALLGRAPAEPARTVRPGAGTAAGMARMSERGAEYPSCAAHKRGLK